MSHIKHLPYHIDPAADRNHFYETLWKEKAFELLLNHEREVKSWSLLDYGCGRGETLKMAKELGMVVKGTDLDRECVRLSDEFGSAELLDVENPVGQFGEKKYDVVSCFHVLEHVPRPVETLNHLREIARKYVLLAVPNLGRIPDLFRQGRNVYEVNEGHLQSWDHSHLLNMAERHCGLKHVAWGFDQVKIPIISSTICRHFGQKAAIRLETGLFRRMFPYQSTSIIALFKVCDS
jgi:SAM-dependent methyltransferase